MTTTINITNWRYHRRSTTKPMGDLPLGTVLKGNAIEQLQSLPTRSIDCVITSPPYHLLRRYGAGADEIGTETHVDDYVNRLIELCDEIGRVLTPTGTFFLNLGDSFSRGPRYGAPAKSLLLGPERLIVRLLERGWRLRSKIVWAKPNPMPNSVADRFSAAWEPVYFLVRSERYYFDLDVVREPHKTVRHPRPLKTNAKYGGSKPAWAGPLAGANDGLERARAEGRPGHPLGKNPTDHWLIPTAAYRGAHFAVFPEELVRRPLIAGCPERVCTSCGVPWQRERRRDHLGEISPQCMCTASWRRGRVLDPFMGSGTVAVAAERHHRDWLGVELNPAFAAMAEQRVAAFRQQGKAANERRKP